MTSKIMRAIVQVVSSSRTTIGAFLVVAVWACFGPAMHFSDTWQLLINSTSSIVTLLMCFVLNNTQKRDTTAINAKLDALVVAVEMADNRIIGVEHRPEEVAAALHEDIVAEVFGSDSAPIDPAIAPKA